MAFLCDDFRAAIATRLPELERSESTVLGVRGDLTIAYVNPAWDRFAEANGGQALVGDALRDAPLLDALPTALAPQYRDAIARVLETGRSLDHDYECSSASTHRRFRLRLVAVPGGVLMVHHLTLERPQAADRVVSPPSVARYAGPGGLIAMCSHCRMVRRGPQGTTTWDWVPTWVEEPPMNLTHTVCPTCLREHYPRFAEAALRDSGL